MILVQDRGALSELHRAPVSLARAELPAYRGELPVAEQVVEVTLVRIVGRPYLLRGAARGLRRQQWCDRDHRGEQGFGR